MGSTATPTPAIPLAATVLLLRESTQGLQVLMTKRAAGLSFMAGLWVFPGGRLEAADEAPAIAARILGLETVVAATPCMLGLDGQPIAESTALALHVAACRETFEESGVLLARPGPGARSERDTGRLARIDAARAAASDAAAFVRLLEAEDLWLDVGQLVYWSHWITPSFEKKRFDTRFFAVAVAADQAASVDRSELTHHAWLTEREVREHLRSGDMKVAPPTIATLQDLWACHARHGSVTAMLAAERGRSVPPILPKLRPVAGGAAEIVLPWDPEYASLGGESCVVAERYPDYLLALPSRRTFIAR